MAKINYDKLLETFKKKHSEHMAKLEKLKFGSAELWNKEQKTYQKWIDGNILSKGIRYTYQAYSGEPLCLYKILAGKCYGF